MSAIKVGIVAIIVGAIGTVAILVTPSWFPVAAAVQAHRQDDLYLALMIMSSFIMAVVTVFLVYSVWRWRARPGDELRDGPPIHGNTTLEILWTVIPTIIVIAFAVAGGVVLVKNEQTTSQELVVQGHRPAVRVDVPLPQRRRHARSWCSRRAGPRSSPSPRSCTT